jgi:hypothetical protein
VLQAPLPLKILFCPEFQYKEKWMPYYESPSKNRGACYKNGKNNFLGPITRNHSKISPPSQQ